MEGHCTCCFKRSMCTSYWFYVDTNKLLGSGSCGQEG